MRQETGTRRGPLSGLRVIEFAGLGPAPFACMLLADMGADVVSVDRPGTHIGDPLRIVNRGREVIHADLKSAADRENILTLIARADVLVEGFRPGVMERLGLGPDVVMPLNPALVYGRMTGWGQEGVLASTAGHDINYLALTGALAAIGTPERPVVPLNLLGDYAGGSLHLALGILAAVYEARASGVGQVVDAAIADGVIQLMALFIGEQQRGRFSEHRESNMLDGGAPWYGVYPTSDGRHVAVGAIEPKFYALFVERLGLDQVWQDAQHDVARWPQLRAAIGAAIGSRTRAECEALFAGSDACVTPVLTLSEAMQHPHNVFRGSFVSLDGAVQPAPAPRFSHAPVPSASPPSIGPVAPESVLRRWQSREACRADNVRREPNP
ncbi:CaiB/BaiF CoA transferase family protein [Candidimonas nitroreducens]|uniref:Carnitine dehydratase n=1 Tax=Candidimonas nitroreducens TaxID=683354 RepID=A0A225MQS9_9BURK|nr:CaiB/BaiF CoA-transferase family protein [Candidimonas nitroreducens]OWT63578.1 carnitine dehydratase [Candidimonas nitroreducens]